MKIRNTIFSVIAAISLCACSAGGVEPETTSSPRLVGAFQSENDGASETAAVKNGGSEVNAQGKQSLVVALGTNDNYNEYLIDISAAFMRARTDVGMDFVTVGTPEAPYYNNIRSKLRGISTINGTGPDIIFMGSVLNEENVSAVYTLADLSEMMDGDASFARSDYFENILDAATKDGRLQVMPISFGFRSVYLNKKYESLLDKPFEEYKTVTFEQMLDIYDMAARTYSKENELLFLDYPINGQGVYWAYDLNGLNPDEAYLFSSSLEKVDLLRRWLSIPDLDSNFYAKVQKGTESMKGIERVFGSIYTDFGAGYIGTSVLGYRESNFTKPAVMTASNGDIMFNYQWALAVNAASANKELAWEFVKFCMENKPVESGSQGEQIILLPQSINKERYRERMEAEYSAVYDMNAELGYFPGKSKSEAVWEAADYWVSMAEQCNRLDFYTDDSLANYQSPLNDYRAGKATFEKTVERIEAIIRESIGLD